MPFGGFAKVLCRHWLNKLALIRLPLNKVGSLSKIRKALSQLEQEFDREPTAEELAKFLDIDVKEVETTLKLSSR
jgi:RNA polymerase primary sigma factor